MKITIPIEVEIDHPHYLSKQWVCKCKTLGTDDDGPTWDAYRYYKETPEQAIVGIANTIKDKLTSEWLAMKIWEKFVKGNHNE
jgi:NADPH-dependent 7-cyano-7-deazaguanine reductase QueF